MPVDALTIPADRSAVEDLATRGLHMAVVDPADDDQVRAWVRADARGFHDGEPTDEFLAALRDDFPLQRTVGVYDASLPEPEIPVATVTSWPAALSLPGGEVRAWAISGVTVAPTHRRRGVARGILESELRVAVEAGLPVAALTVSEATIYGRWGFAPAAWSAGLTIDARRARPIAPPAAGRVELVGRATAMIGARALLEEARRATPGDVEIVGHRFDRLFGSQADLPELRRRRFARYVDAEGAVRGFAVYTLAEHTSDFTLHTVEVQHLATVTDDAYRALWSYLTDIDLVAKITVSLRSTDEPLRWLVADQRAIRTTELREHLWVRVLDPLAAFSARTYGGAGRLGLRFADPLGHADGLLVLESDRDGRATATAGEPAAGVPTLDVPIDVAGSLLVGGVSAVTLARAGRLTERTPGDAVAADRLLASPVAPLLTTWF